MKLTYAVLSLLACASMSRAAVYEIGPGRAFATPGDFSWYKLMPGDTVLIYWQSTPYRNKWAIWKPGTAAAPITVRGVPSAGGDRPIIDGEDAVSRNVPYNAERGVVQIGVLESTEPVRPEYIVIEGLEIRNGRAGVRYFDTSGETRYYAQNAAALYVSKGSHITIRDCLLRTSSNGLFISPGSGLTPNADFLIEGNHFDRNGNPGSGMEHQSYTEVAGITFQYNRYGAMAAGSEGHALKDRSAGTVIRYNWIEDGNRHIDLPDSSKPQIYSDPRYPETFVYGNTFIENENPYNRQIILYGGDTGVTMNYRKGLLHFFNNTVVSRRVGETAIFRMPTSEQRVDARNNIFYVTAKGSSLLIVDKDTGVVELHRNWMKPGWKSSTSALTMNVVDDGSTITSDSPGFMDEQAMNFELTAMSPNVDAATLLNPLVLPNHDVLLQYVVHQKASPRNTRGRLDVGAFEMSLSGTGWVQFLAGPASDGAGQSPARP